MSLDMIVILQMNKFETLHKLIIYTWEDTFRPLKEMWDEWEMKFDKFQRTKQHIFDGNELFSIPSPYFRASKLACTYNSFFFLAKSTISVKILRNEIYLKWNREEVGKVTLSTHVTTLLVGWIFPQVN